MLALSVCWRPWLSVMMESINIHFIHIWWVNVALPLHTTGGSCNQQSHTPWIIIYPDNGRVYASTEKKVDFFAPLLFFFLWQRELWLGNNMTDFLSFLLFGLFRPLICQIILLAPSHIQDNSPRNKSSKKRLACCHLTTPKMWSNNWSNVYNAHT